MTLVFTDKDSRITYAKSITLRVWDELEETPLRGCNPGDPIELKSMKRGPRNPEFVDFQKCMVKRWNKQKVEIQ